TRKKKNRRKTSPFENISTPLVSKSKKNIRRSTKNTNNKQKQVADVSEFRDETKLSLEKDGQRFGNCERGIDLLYLVGKEAVE
ncbi:unnamed protein product, partial [Amoebophrya sp. A25]